MQISGSTKSPLPHSRNASNSQGLTPFYPPLHAQWGPLSTLHQAHSAPAPQPCQGRMQGPKTCRDTELPWGIRPFCTLAAIGGTLKLPLGPWLSPPVRGLEALCKLSSGACGIASSMDLPMSAKGVQAAGTMDADIPPCTSCPALGAQSYLLGSALPH